MRAKMHNTWRVGCQSAAKEQSVYSRGFCVSLALKETWSHILSSLALISMILSLRHWKDSDPQEPQWEMRFCWLLIVSGMEKEQENSWVPYMMRSKWFNSQSSHFFFFFFFLGITRIYKQRTIPQSYQIWFHFCKNLMLSLSMSPVRCHLHGGRALLNATFMVSSPQEHHPLYINFRMLTTSISHHREPIHCPVSEATCPMFQLRDSENEMKKRKFGH